MFQHCRPAVDEETFQRMVERQYEAYRRERMRAIEEQNKPPTQNKPDEVESPNTAQPAVASAPPSDGQNPEVIFHIFYFIGIILM